MTRGGGVDKPPDSAYDVVVVGGGIVGLSILRSVTLAGYDAALVEKEPHLLSWASGTNSGIACTGVDAAPGTLERALIRDSISQIRVFCREHNVPARPCGSLVCRWPWDADDRLDEVLAESHDAGDMDATKLTARQVQEREANIDPSCAGAVHIPGEIVVDPWLFSVAFAVHARENGARIFTNFEMDPNKSSFEEGIWTVCRKESIAVMPVDSSTMRSIPSKLTAKVVVSATGLWADTVQKQTLDLRPKWVAKPRRGQYRIFRSNGRTKITHPIQPVPTPRTKGIFVFSSLYDQIIVGPTALDQESLTDRSVDPVVGEELAKYVQKIIPQLDTETDYVGDYVGIRPGSNQRDYQIHLDASKRWLVCAGIRSTGLTASLGIGRHALCLLQEMLPTPSSVNLMKKCTPLPPIEDLVDDFHRRGDETVEINSHAYKVTHPITVFGWRERSGLAI